MTRKKRYLVQEVRPGDEAHIRNHPDNLMQRCCINGEEEKITPLPRGATPLPPEGEQIVSISPQVFPALGDLVDSMIRDEMEKEEANKPPIMTHPRDLAAMLLDRLGGLDVKAEPASMSFPVRIGPAEAEVDYKLTVSLRAENRRTLAGAIDTAIRAGQQDILAGPVVLYLYAVQGHDRIRTSANGLPYVELKYIFRLRETTPKQEV